MRILFIMTVLLLTLGKAQASEQIECIAKRSDQKNGEYQEALLEGNTDPKGIYSTNITLSDCYFQAQSLYPDKLMQIYIRHNPEIDGVSTYNGFDPKGHMIISLSKDEGKLICMLHCYKK